MEARGSGKQKDKQAEWDREADVMRLQKAKYTASTEAQEKGLQRLLEAKRR
jgi:hypothetical protein